MCKLPPDFVCSFSPASQAIFPDCASLCQRLGMVIFLDMVGLGGKLSPSDAGHRHVTSVPSI
jgi:hypothetical protein